MNLPTVTVLSTPFADRARRFKLVGGDIAPRWRKHIDEMNARAAACGQSLLEIECEITIWNRRIFVGVGKPGADRNGFKTTEELGDQIDSFGGGVWPSAWPEVFDVPDLLTGGRGRGTTLTEIGCKLLLEAIAAAEGEDEPSRPVPSAPECEANAQQ